jgi:hypothetical protein
LDLDEFGYGALVSLEVLFLDEFVLDDLHRRWTGMDYSPGCRLYFFKHSGIDVFNLHSKNIDPAGQCLDFFGVCETTIDVGEGGWSWGNYLLRWPIFTTVEDQYVDIEQSGGSGQHPPKLPSAWKEQVRGNNKTLET